MADERLGWVYFIAGEGTRTIKVGWAGYSAKERLAALQTSSPVRLILLGTIPGTRRDEKRLHMMLARYRTHGEWFTSASEVVEFIEGVIAAQVIPSRPALREVMPRTIVRGHGLGCSSCGRAFGEKQGPAKQYQDVEGNDYLVCYHCLFNGRVGMRRLAPVAYAAT